MPVLKSDQTRPMIKDAIVLDLGDLSRQAARIKAHAEAQAAQILDDAERKAAALIASAESQGYEKGHAEGVEQGVKDGREQGKAQALQEYSARLQQLHASWSDVVQQWDLYRQELERDAREAVVDLALRMTEVLLNRVIEVDRTIVVDQVANALTYVLQPCDVTVRIHASDRPVLEEALPQLLSEFSNARHVEIVEDETIGPGGCVINYGQGRIDARLDTQLRRIIDLILPQQSDNAEGEEDVGQSGMVGASSSSSSSSSPAEVDGSTQTLASDGGAADGGQGEGAVTNATEPSDNDQ